MGGSRDASILMQLNCIEIARNTTRNIQIIWPVEDDLKLNGTSTLTLFETET